MPLDLPVPGGDAGTWDEKLNAALTQLDAEKAPAFPTMAITYDASGNPLTVTEDGVTTTYTYNADGTVATATRLGVTKTYAYSGGNLTAVA